MGLFSFGSKREQQEQEEILSIYGLTQQDVEDNEQQTSIPWHCGWCQPYVNGATTGICQECEAKYFPHKR